MKEKKWKWYKWPEFKPLQSGHYLVWVEDNFNLGYNNQAVIAYYDINKKDFEQEGILEDLYEGIKAWCYINPPN